MSTTIRYILLTALRDWLFLGLFIAIALAFAVASFLGDTALVEESQMATTYAAGSTRVILLIGLIVFVCFHVRNAFSNKEIDLMLSRPISRTAFVISYWIGFACIAFLLCAALALLFIVQGVDALGLSYWIASMAMESLFVVAFALFASLILRSAVASVLLALAVLAQLRG